MNKFKTIITLFLTFMTSTGWATEFVDPRSYTHEQNAQLHDFAYEMALKNYGPKRMKIVHMMTEKLVEACIWLSKYAEDEALLTQVVEEWRDCDGDYIMMKFAYEREKAKMFEDDAQLTDELF